MKFAVMTLIYLFTFLQLTNSFCQTVSGFSQWRTGRDEQTTQLLPASSDDPVEMVKGDAVVHVKFVVKQYGEVSFPINQHTPKDTEAMRADIAKSTYVTVTYQANHEFILQLRQTGVHGGIQNHVTLPASKKYKTVKLYFSEFKEGKSPLNLSDVSKFNFAFLGNNPEEGFAELRIAAIVIEGYTP